MAINNHIVIAITFTVATDDAEADATANHSGFGSNLDQFSSNQKCNFFS